MGQVKQKGKTRSYKRFYTLFKLLNDLGYELEKEHVVFSLSEKTTSLSELTDKEYESVCIKLQKMLNDSKKKTEMTDEQRKKWENSPENKMRRKIIAQFHELGYPNPVEAAKRWANKYSGLDKDFNEYTKDELITLVHQATEMARTTTRDVHKPSRNK